MHDNPKRVLKHFGILGMKWGRRKNPTHEDRRSAVDSLRGRHVKTLSNAELQKALTRLRLEREYKTLTSQSTSSGKKFVDFFLKNFDKEKFSKVVTGIADAGMRKVMNEGLE